MGASTEFTKKRILVKAGWRRYYTFRVQGWLNGKRIRMNFKDEAEADGELLKRNIEVANENSARKVTAQNTHLTDEQINEAEAAFQRLNGKSLTLAVDHFIETYHEPATTLPLEKIMEQFLAEKKGEITEIVHGTYRRDIWSFLGPLERKKQLHKIQPIDVENFLTSRRCPTVGRHTKWATEGGLKVPAKIGPCRWNHLRTTLNTFFEWCRMAPRKWVSENPVHDIRKKKVKHRTPPVVHGKTCIELMAHVMGYKNGILVPYCYLTLFAGIRPAARCGEIWKFANHPDLKDLIKREDSVIQIPPEVAKTGRQRFIVIQPNLARWMDAFPISRYPVYPRNLEAMMTEVRKQFEIGRAHV